MNELFCTKTNPILLADTISSSKGNHTICLETPKATVFGQKQKWKLLFVKFTILIAQPQIAYIFLNDNVDTI